MHKTHRFDFPWRALSAITMISVAVAGCSYVDGQMREIETATPKDARQQPVRTARAEPNIMRSAPRRASDEPTAPGDRPRQLPPQAAIPAGATKAVPPAEQAPAPVPAPAAAPPRAVPAPMAPPAESTPVAPPAPQPRIINPAVPAAPAAPVSPPADPLPSQPAPPPPRPDAVPAPPNRANVTPPRQAGGGIVSARPPVGDEPEQQELAALPPARAATPPPGTPGMNGIEIARQLLAKGKVLEARTHLQAAARVSPALALLELARTYDPFYLGMLPTIDDGSEPRRAAALYQEAIVHGSPTAGTDLDRLRQMHPGLR